MGKHESEHGVWLVILALVLALLSSLGCGADSNGHSRVEPAYRSYAQEELDTLVEEGLAWQMPPPLSEEESELVALKLAHISMAEEMRMRTDDALAPLAMAAAFFAIEGPADFILSIAPIHRVGEAWQVMRRARQLGKARRRADELVTLVAEFEAHLLAAERSLFRLAKRLGASERQALRVIHQRTGSYRVIEKLMNKRFGHDADRVWIAGMLEKNKLDATFVRRFTFDADLVEELVLHRAGPSWRDLQRVVENEPISEKLRSVLAAKIKGLLGERAAAQAVRELGFVEKYLGRRDSLVYVKRGLGYGPSNRSLDVVVYGSGSKMMAIEAKAWSAASWANPRFRKGALR